MVRGGRLGVGLHWDCRGVLRRGCGSFILACVGGVCGPAVLGGVFGAGLGGVVGVGGAGGLIPLLHVFWRLLPGCRGLVCVGGGGGWALRCVSDLRFS